MSRGRATTSDLLNDAADLVKRVASPWLGLLWLLLLPMRLMQAEFVAEIAQLGPQANRYGEYLFRLASLVLMTSILGLYGRAVFVRACRLGLQSRRSPGREAFRVGRIAGASYLVTSLLIMLVFYGGAFTFVAMPIAVVLAGLAAATYASNETLSLIRPFQEIWRSLAQWKLIASFSLVFLLAVVLAFFNLSAALQLGVGLLDNVIGMNMSGWTALFTLDNSRFVLFLAAGAFLAVEPFWLAANVVYVQRLKMMESGEDLTLWFQEIVAKEQP